MHDHNHSHGRHGDDCEAAAAGEPPPAAASRRGFLGGLAGGLASRFAGGGALAPALGLGFSLGASTPAAAAVGFGRGPRSGLPWHSGCSLNPWSEFEVYRKRRIDTCTCWSPHRTWEDVVSLQGGFRSLKNKPPRISLGMAPLPNSHSAVKNPGNLKLAARGSFDGYYTRFTRNLAASGRKDSIVRIGWECNHDRAWFCGADPQAFKDMFKRIADIVRKHNPGVAIEWCCVKKGQQRGSILDSYPGDDAVDIIGVNYYDNWPALNDERTWQTQYQRRFQGGPWGIGAWLDFAKSRGKRFACSEWGVSVGTSADSKDNPFYIRKMFEFFSRNATHIAYENYFNHKGAQHAITPSKYNPKASAEYKRLWGG